MRALIGMFPLALIVIALGALAAAGAVFPAWRLRRAMRLHGAVLSALQSESGQHSQYLASVGQGLIALKNDLTALKNDLTALKNDLNRLRNDLKRRPFDISLSEADTYDNLDQNQLSVRDTSGRKETVAVIDGERKRTAVIVILGQSNSANHGSGRYVAKHRVDNFNIYDGKCYHAEDPLLGASGEGGNFATRLGDKLIEDGLFDRVILAPIGMGGSKVEQWADQGMFNRRILVLIRRLYDAGLTADFILWHQGESNLGAGDSGGREYRKHLLEVVRGFRRYAVSAPFFVALATFRGEPHPNADNIRAGQRSAVDPSLGIYQGPDTDILGVEYRRDKRHFDELGLALAATLWLETIASYRPAPAQSEV